MNNIVISVGFKKKNTYKQLQKLTTLKDIINSYNEDEIIKYPYMYYKNNNRKVEHVEIYDVNIAKQVLKMISINIDLNDFYCMSLGLLWNIKRKGYDTEFTFNNLSGTIFYNDCQHENFVVSDNIVKNESQQLANNIIDYVNKLCV